MGRRLQPGIDKIEESWVKAKVKDILKNYKNIKVDMPPAAIYGTAGRHDFIICQRGCFWTIETKSNGNKPTELQISYASDIKSAGGISLVIDEYNFLEVDTVACYIDFMGSLPYHLNHNFREYKPRKKSKIKNAS